MFNKYKIAGAPLILSLILTWMAFLTSLFGFWRFYPPQDPTKQYIQWQKAIELFINKENGSFVQVALDNLEAYPNSSELEPYKGQINLEELQDGFQTDANLDTGLYFSRYDEELHAETLCHVDIGSGEVEVLAKFDPDESAIKILNDSKRRFLVVWTEVPIGNLFHQRLRIYDAVSGDWRRFKVLDNIKPYLLIKESNNDGYSSDAAFYSLDGRYFLFTVAEWGFEPRFVSYLVFDSRVGDFFHVPVFVTWGSLGRRVIESINREPGKATFWLTGYYLVPPLLGQIYWDYRDLSVFENVRSPRSYGDSFLKRYEVDIPTGKINDMGISKTPAFPWAVMPIGKEKVLLVLHFFEHDQVKQEIRLLWDGAFSNTGVELPGDLFGLDDRITYFSEWNLLLIERPNDDSHSNMPGTTLIWMNLTSHEVGMIAHIPSTLIGPQTELAKSIDTGIICAPLTWEETDTYGQISHRTEFKFYDIANLQEGGSLMLPGTVSAAHLILDVGDPYPKYGETVISSGIEE